MDKMKKAEPWWMWLIAVDVIFVIITTLYHYIPDFYGKDRLLGPFDLAVEMNVAAWWAGIGFIVLSFIAYERFCTGNDGAKIGWLTLAILLAALFCDEIGSLHERVGEWSRLLPFGIVAVALLTYSLITLYKREETRKAALFILGGFVLFGTVALQEHLEFALNWPTWALGIRAGIEEGTELAGTFLIFWGVVNPRQQGALSSWQSAIPNLYKMRNIRGIILCGMFLHLIASVILPHIIELRSQRRGNPLVLYPAAIYIMLSLGSLRQYLNSGADRRRTFALVSAFFAVCSLGAMFNLYIFLPKVSWIMPERFISSFHSLHLLQLAVIVILLMKRSVIFENMKMTLPYMLLAFLIIGFMVRGMSMQAIEAGVVAWLFAQVFLPQMTRQQATSQESDLVSGGS